MMVVAIVVGVLLIALVLIYNGLVRSRNKVDEAWSGIDVQLKRRHDLVPNLVETVKGYAEHEQRVLNEVTNARQTAVSASGPAEAAPAEQALGAALGRVVALAEAYPQLRASESFVELQGELSETEDQIAGARRIYNSNTQVYNSRIQTIPGLLVAPVTGFRAREYFEMDDAGDAAPVGVAFSRGTA